jgi:dihydroorotate dehydrogenase (fumarate)
MGLSLENPIIVGSSGLTSTVDRVKECDAAGAGAVVLKSIFEEQITAEVERLRDSGGASYWHSEAEEYIREYGRHHAAEAYIDLIKACKDSVSIPVIASIHCVSDGGWTEYAHKVEHAGADALELNVYVLPSDPRRDGRDNEQVYFDVVRSVRSVSTIPLALKIGSSFSSISNMCIALGASDVQALVLFNRFYRFDFDIDELRMVPAPYISSPDEMAIPLRWISILAGKVDCDLCATTGIHDGAGVVKQLLAGATTVQVCSALYKHGVGHLEKLLGDVSAWMEKHGRASMDEFRGKMSRDESSDPAAYERVQFMKGSVAVE